MQYLRPIIEECQRTTVELGEGWSERPVSKPKRKSRCPLTTCAQTDLLQSLLDKATVKNEPTVATVQRLLVLNFVGIHSTSNVSTITLALSCHAQFKTAGSFQTLTYALYHLAEKPEFIAALREEIETSIAADGWTGAAMGNMWKLDSLLRETLRYHGVSVCKHTLTSLYCGYKND